jgi:hypothetical protein
MSFRLGTAHAAFVFALGSALTSACGPATESSADDPELLASDAAELTPIVVPGAQAESADSCALPGRRRFGRELSARLLGRYATGLEGLESSAETAALRGNRMYVTSAEAVALDVVDVSNAAAPVLLTRVDLSAYGASVQSVDVSARGLVAVAVGGVEKTAAGTIVFLNRNGVILRTATVGSLPDMVTFTHDGERLVVANEGEPSCYGEGCVDPEGSVSIIEVSPLRATLPVKTLSFAEVVLPTGVRVFGPGATPAQDLEPEYISISDDDRTAYVTLQENNALAVIDLEAAKIKEVRALGYKAFSKAPTTTTYELDEPPSIGLTAAGQALELGGFSGLFFEGRTADGRLRFVTHTDRGPNGEPVDGRRPFLLPDFVPAVVRVELDPARGSVRIRQRIELKRGDGSPLSGLSNSAVEGGTASTPHDDEEAIDLFGNALPLDPLGGDFEGIAVDTDGSFWLADEYRPAIYHFDATGTLLARLVPIGSHAAAGKAVPAPGQAGDLGIEALPAVIGQRRQNRGFEALALQGGKLYALVQSPLRNPTGLDNASLNAMRNARLVEIDPTTLVTRQFLYVMDNAPSVSADDTRADKLGDMTALPTGTFFVVERDDDALPADAPQTIAKKVYAFALAGATDITSLDALHTSKSLDQMTSSELATVGVKPLAKVLHVDLVQAGYANVQKVEGLAMVDATTLAVVNDNDFGVAAIAIDQTMGTFTRAVGYVPEPTLFGIIETGGMDASDRDGVTNIRNWPVYGMYQPDAVASFKACGNSYLVTANEGDARDYDGFAEEVRARSVKASYPAIPEVGDDLQLGRLTITASPPDGDLSQPYVFGTRSFSIWNAKTGAQVWDSGAELEALSAAAFPAFFNGNNDSNDFDTRSDNKGPEPEGLTVGKMRGRSYAFVTLERIGGVVIYDVTNPAAPSFVQYLNTRDFTGPGIGPDSGPEIVRFISAEHSPTRAPLLVISNEISGTVTLWSLDF